MRDAPHGVQATDWQRLCNGLAHAPAVLVRVTRTQGSVPREVGAWMAVFAERWSEASAAANAERPVGSIGGGHLEWQAQQRAGEMLGRTGSAAQQTWDYEVALGPSLGQCCGGRVGLRLQMVGAADLPWLREALCPAERPLALFGAGHVGRALVQAVQPLPFALRWIDSRDQPFPMDVSGRVSTEHADPVQSVVADLAPNSLVVVMSFSHAEDLEVVAACLARQRARADLPFVGLIGSATKWARFDRRLQDRGYTPVERAHITCPIGVPGIAGKAPAVIAASVVAQLLLQSQAPKPTLQAV